MKKIVFLGTLIVIVLVVILTILVVLRNSSSIPEIPHGTPITTPSATPITIYPEYLFPSPEQVGPSEDLNSFESLSIEEKEYNLLLTSLPINTPDYSVQYNFNFSAFYVTVLNDKGWEQYIALRKKYSNLDDDYFVVIDERPY